MRRLAVALAAAVLLWAMKRAGAAMPYRALDGRLCYSFADAAALLASLTPESRALYVRQALADLVFIALYVPFLRRLLPRERLLWGPLSRAPLLTGACDALETATVLLVLLGALPEAALLLPVVMTPLKWAGASACLAALLTRRW